MTNSIKENYYSRRLFFFLFSSILPSSSHHHHHHHWVLQHTKLLNSNKLSISIFFFKLKSKSILKFKNQRRWNGSSEKKETNTKWTSDGIIDIEIWRDFFLILLTLFIFGWLLVCFYRILLKFNWKRQESIERIVICDQYYNKIKEWKSMLYSNTIVGCEIWFNEADKSEKHRKNSLSFRFKHVLNNQLKLME